MSRDEGNRTRHVNAIAGVDRRQDVPVATVIRGLETGGRGRAVVKGQRGGDSAVRSLCNGDAGDSDARYFADGHLE